MFEAKLLTEKILSLFSLKNPLFKPHKQISKKCGSLIRQKKSPYLDEGKEHEEFIFPRSLKTSFLLGLPLKSILQAFL